LQEHFEYVLVIDGKSLCIAMEHCCEMLAGLASVCNSVLGCRLSPRQKADIVRMVKNRKDKSTGRYPVTLAIGDGANDVAMIREAHVGVGILGKEGRQAARSSDYSIGRFEFLAPLLLVHGQRNYWRIAYTIQYFFYKELVFILPVIYYCAWSLFSAQTLYESWLMMLYNVVFTSAPILVFGIFEQEIPYDKLLDYSRVYRSRVGTSTLSWREFVVWSLAGLVQGTLCFFFYLGGLAHNPEEGLFSVGTAINFFVITTVTLKIALDTRCWTVFSFLGIFGSVLLLTAFLLVYSGIYNVFGSSGVQMYGVFEHLLGTRLFWAMLCLIPCMAVLPFYAVMLITRAARPDGMQQAQDAIWNAKAAGNGNKPDEQTPLLVSNA
jgi:phospholipid-translocating ATPase